MKIFGNIVLLLFVFSAFLFITLFPIQATADGPESPQNGQSSLDTPPFFFPEQGATHIPTTTVCIWDKRVYADSYDFRISTDKLFGTITFSRDSIRENYVLVHNLNKGTVYYWKYRGNVNAVVGKWVVSRFTTEGSDTTTILTSSVNPANIGAKITLSAFVLDNYGNSMPTGTVTFSEMGDYSGTSTLGNGTAYLSVSDLTMGHHVFTAAYSGDTIHTASMSSPLTLVVNEYASTTYLSSSLNPSRNEQSATLTATVKETNGTEIPEGEVVFTMNGTTINTLPLIAGKAEFSIQYLEPGSYVFSAIYNGKGDVAGSQSSELTQIVTTTSFINNSVFFILLLCLGIFCATAGITTVLVSSRRVLAPVPNSNPRGLLVFGVFLIIFSVVCVILLILGRTL